MTKLDKSLEKTAHFLLDQFLDGCMAAGVTAKDAVVLAYAVAESIQATNEDWAATGRGDELDKPLGLMGDGGRWQMTSLWQLIASMVEGLAKHKLTTALWGMWLMAWMLILPTLAFCGVWLVIDLFKGSWLWLLQIGCLFWNINSLSRLIRTGPPWRHHASNSTHIHLVTYKS